MSVKQNKHKTEKYSMTNTLSSPKFVGSTTCKVIKCMNANISSCLVYMEIYDLSHNVTELSN